MYNPFIPEDRWVDFNISFYSNLIAGFITSIITGVVVGIIIWKIQKRNELNENKKQATREVEIFLQHLKITLTSSPNFIFENSGEKVLPLNLSKSLNLITKSPITYWFQATDAYMVELNICLNLLKNYQELIKISTHLDDALKDRLLEDYDELNYSDYIAPFYAVICGVPDNIITKRFTIFSPITEENINQLKLISKEAGLLTLVESYIRQRSDMLQQLNRLESIIM